MSLWEKEDYKKDYPSLEADKHVDTLIIGGGMTGIQTLYFLKEQNSVMLVEGNKVGHGVSMNTTGKINYLQENTLGYFILTKQYTKTKMYLASQLEGMTLIRDIILKEQIDCQFEQVTSYLVTNKEQHVKELKKIEKFLQSINISVLDLNDTLKKKFLYGIGVLDTYVFHPLKYMYGLLKHISHPVYENTRIINIKKIKTGYLCETNHHYKIYAKNVIVSCHYPFFLFPYFLPIKTTIEKSYLCAYPVLENKKYTYITMENPSLSTRFYENGKEIYQIFLSNSHKTSVKQDDKKHFENLIPKVNDGQKILWSNVDVLTFDHLPIIGRIKENLYLATGFQTWGMINSAVAAKMLTQFINKEESSYQRLFYPYRSFLLRTFLSVPYLFYNAFSFVRSKWYNKKWYSKNLTFFFENGKLVACFKDENHKKHLVYPVCPHMKCNLIFNEVEKTWDCPCHSSRFDLDGNVIKGPSKYSIRVHKKS